VADVSSSHTYAHRKLRKQWKVIVERGDASCARCQHPIAPDAPFDLDHNEDRTGYIGVSHASCNRATLTHARQAAVTSGYEWF
jgi:hypothetical protein